MLLASLITAIPDFSEATAPKNATPDGGLAAAPTPVYALDFAT
jgi:hypothetical protein